MNAKTLSYLKEDPKRLFSLMGSKGLLNWLPDKLYIEVLFRLTMGCWPDLENPQTFNEKLQWLKLYDRNPLYTTLVDKYAVRGYIAQRLGEEYLIPLVGGPWKNAGEIDFDTLPEQFVLKCNHDSGGVIICRDKSKLDIEAVRAKLDKRLGTNYYYGHREWPYKNVEPCVIAEKLLGNGNCQDYKFFCFGGEPKLMFIATDGADDPRTDFFDMDFTHLDIRMRDPGFDVLPEKPENFEEMKRLAKILAQNLPFLRADFYSVDGRVYVGEQTLYHNSGFSHISPPEWERKMGAWIALTVQE